MKSKIIAILSQINTEKQILMNFKVVLSTQKFSHIWNFTFQNHLWSRKKITYDIQKEMNYSNVKVNNSINIVSKNYVQTSTEKTLFRQFRSENWRTRYPNVKPTRPLT